MADDAHNYDFSTLGYSNRVQLDYEGLVSELSLDGSGDSLLGLEPARIVKVDRGFPLVAACSGSYRTELSSGLAKVARKDALSRPAVGDWIVLSHPENHEFGIVEAFLPRYSSLKRRDPLERKSAGFAPAQQAVGQVVVSNIDIIFVVQALSANCTGVNLARLERELVLAFESGAKPIVVLTKADLCPDPEVAARFVEQSTADAPIIIESAVTGLGISEIRRLIGPGITASLLGASGVGKSTLINRLLGHERQQTKAVRENDDRGRHATVARELIELPLEEGSEGSTGGGVIIDTPGMRSLALWQADEGIALAFPEIVEAAHDCRFADCAHDNEPKCAVKAAIKRKEIDEDRYRRYLNLVKELADA
ncbi:MAG: ribosome small subunit-dependent GTPase A [Coriobacteriia bacterium]|nr:ribosome small subunit-dependent GTPase A [Coriobacteriia bacterium]MCL2746109.1 ribosome small subunit-dependent GTPase A [Coriobacteriia bacterium]MCL2870280.1 ribosome small subunit-dependent GTPase A [Coriobacteriia bacterium]